MIACAFRRRGCRPCLVVRFVWAGFCAALLLFALLFFAEAKVTTGASQWRALLHDGEIVLGRRRLPANDPGETSGLVEIANNPFEMTILPGVSWRGPLVEVALPLWIPAALTACWALIGWRRVHRRKAHECASCGYDRTGLRAGATCPECGAAAVRARSSAS